MIQTDRLNLHLYDAPELGKGPSWVDVVNRNPYDSKGIPGVLINEHYRDIALQTIRIAFNNPDEEKLKNWENQQVDWHQVQLEFWIM
ncbi:hypothetical protein [Mycoplasmopsis cynos]|uniref:hypothetical protein n=1 Tax=Mycoplasmopsis cynos TaxID=171284 RepID=UPI0024CDE856|nr:hypothetical protein [Mycoplasmopsis cynos]WAM07667.1 hypothetical protein ONA21_06105 [Mycoplasmopsis cynos]